MSLHSDQKALMFIGVVAVLGTGVRALRAASNDETPTAQPALARQTQAADSAAAAQRNAKSVKGAQSGRGRGRRGRGRAGPGADPKTLDRNGRGADTTRGLLDRPGY